MLCWREPRVERLLPSLSSVSLCLCGENAFALDLSPHCRDFPSEVSCMMSRSGSAVPVFDVHSLSRAEKVRAQVESDLAKKIPSALTVREKPAVEVFSTGIREVDAAIARESG